MYVAGYEFHVLANIFTNHAGFQVGYDTVIFVRQTQRAPEFDVFGILVMKQICSFNQSK